MIERVRAILITPNDTMLAIKRVRPGVPVYWVLPGGRLEEDDASREAALDREIREEIAGEADIVSLLHIVESETERQLFYLACIEQWSFADRTGPEFSERGRGEYILEEVQLTADALEAIDLKPGEIATYLREVLLDGGSLYAQADLRQAGVAAADQTPYEVRQEFEDRQSAA